MGARQAVKSPGNRTEALRTAIYLVELAEDDPEVFDGPLKRDQVLVGDLVDRAYGIGPKLAARIYETSGLKSNARIADLSYAELERLARALGALLLQAQRE